MVVLLGMTMRQETSAAAKQRHVQMSVDWGRETYPGYFTTTWGAKADPGLEVRLSRYFPWHGSTVNVDLTPSGTSQGYLAAPYHIYSVKGFYMMVPGATHAFAGSFWDVNSCLPGPFVSIDTDRKVQIVNNTDVPLFATFNEGKSWNRLGPGVELQRSVSKRGFAYIKLAPDMSSPTCADVRWWFDKEDGL